MKNIVWALLFSLLFTSCAKGGAAGKAVTDTASLMERLQVGSVTVQNGGAASSSFFSGKGQNIKVNDAEVQVFEYANEEAARADAAKISSNGSQIGGAMIKWAGSPHFYLRGRLLVAYIGDDPGMKNLLEETLGPQYAGM